MFNTFLMTPVNINNMIVQWSGLWPTHSLRWNGSNQIIDRQWVVSIWKRYFYQNQFYFEMGIKYWFSNSDSIKPGKNLYWKNQLWLGFEIEAGSEMHQEMPSTLPCSLDVACRGNWVFFSVSPYIFRDVTHDQVISNHNYYLKGKVSALPCDS